jgi:DNA polymerase-3 subunit delta'
VTEAPAAPDLFPRLKGQAFARRILQAGMDADRSASSYLFHGPPGCGKKTAAFDLANALIHPDGVVDARIARNAHPDVRLHSPGGASFKVEQIRELLKDASLRPFEGSQRVFILDRAESLNDASANALLKSIEEPGLGFTWILVTTQRARILPTIASRCQAVRFFPLDEATLKGVLATELKASEAEARDLAALSGGSVRLAVWLRTEDGKAMLAQAEGFLEAAAAGGLVGRLNWAAGAGEDRRELDTLLGLTWVLLRERWAEAKGLPQALRLMSKPPQHGKALPLGVLERLLEALPKAQADLGRNANVALTLDALALAAER